MKIITISGLDGSGKSTQLKILKENLTKKGYQVFDFHMIDFSIANKILGKNQKSRKDEDEIRKPKAKTKTGFLGIAFRKIALMIDLQRFKKLVKKMNQENEFDFLITDRYFYDQIINIIYLEKSLPEKDKCWRKWSEKLITNPDHKIYLELNPSIIIERNEDIEQSFDYFNDKNNLYKQLSRKWELNIINADGTIENIQEKINDLISS
jgi:dTMP kinase